MGLKDKWNSLIENEGEIYIYGAGKIGRKILRQLMRDGKEDNVLGFLVSDVKKNPQMVVAKPVLPISSLQDKSVLILIAVSNRYQEEIWTLLKSLGFKNVEDAYKYAFFDDEMENTVDVVEIKELLEKYNEGIKLGRYDIAVRLLAIEEYYGRNTYGWTLYKRMQDERVYAGYAELATQRFERLIKSFEADGYDTDSEILVSKNLKLIDGAHRVALAIYYGLSYVKVRILDGKEAKSFGLDWFEERFDTEDCRKIADKREKMQKEIEENRKSDIERLKEQIYCFFGKNQSFGRGEFYQSFEELGIKGQRPTEERIKIYGLTDIVRGKKVFDIGCNCGFMDLRLGREAKSVKGFEYNSTLIKIGEKVKKYLEQENVCFEPGDFKEYKISEKYDVVLSFAVHYWIGLPVEEYCKKVASMIEEGGYLVFESQNIEKNDTEFEKYCWEFGKRGLMKIREDMIRDDGEILRKFIVYKNVDSEYE